MTAFKAIYKIKLNGSSGQEIRVTPKQVTKKNVTNPGTFWFSSVEDAINKVEKEAIKKSNILGVTICWQVWDNQGNLITNGSV